ncbi:PLP-dependent aminotransferase family protein [Sporofaciens sp. SGI.106]|uniref:MocR-like pyridoxine biosynthesis transcription factor PdxR n=1 Tax=Sporofaciens sp. SGI.106 TaxID=3420568 RepID=UPI003D06576C
MNELTINLKSKDKAPLYEQIYQYIKENIQSGKIPYGEKLPSTRALSRHLEVSRSTVELAYEQLLSEGYVETEPCRGYYVAQIEELYHLDAMEVSPDTEQKQQESKRKYRYDFTPNGVDLKSFPYNAWRKLSREILSDDRVELFRSGDSMGEYSFRKAICTYLYQARGVNCTPSQIIVGAGSDYLLMLLCAILGREHIVAVENPTYKQAYRLFRSLSYKVVPVDMDRYGMKVEELRGEDADIAYVTPSHQYPTGIVMPIKRRMELLRWADDADGRYIIEDDYDSEFRYKGKPIPALQGYDRHEKVVYLGTFSKSIAPALRLSYMVLPRPLLKNYEANCRFVNSTVSKVDQLIVQRFIEEGYYERHLNKTRALYKSRHDQLIAGLKPLSGQCCISGEHAGVHLLLTFVNGMTEQELIARAEKEDIRVYGLSDYFARKDTQEKSTVLLGYANLTEKQIQEACKILCNIWRTK